jgi:predicted lactoylglutathione lyase
MKIRTTILCFPVTNLEKTLDFYKAVFGMNDATIDEGMIALELPNLSLFLIEKEAYEVYSKKANRNAMMPNSSAPAILSCALESKEEVDEALIKAENHGGKSAGAAAIDSATGGYTGYITDPDGHLWELVHPRAQS